MFCSSLKASIYVQQRLQTGVGDGERRCLIFWRKAKVWFPVNVSFPEFKTAITSSLPLFFIIASRSHPTPSESSSLSFEPQTTRSKKICIESAEIWSALIQVMSCVTDRIKHAYPADTLRNNDVVITSKQRHFDLITSKLRRLDVIVTFLLRHVFSGYILVYQCNK